MRQKYSQAKNNDIANYRCDSDKAELKTGARLMEMKAGEDDSRRADSGLTSEDEEVVEEDEYGREDSIETACEVELR